MKAHRFVGLANPVYLPDDIIVEVAIVPSSVRNVRSNQWRGANEVRTFTTHETANYNTGANADMHRRWLHSGASGSYVGFNLVVDDKKLIQLTPFDEVTWAAGTPQGNRTSDHLEICVNRDIDHAKARRNGAAVAAGVLKSRGLSINAGLVQHHYWTRKNCPALMRANNNAIWNNTFVPMVKEFYSGSTPAPTPTFRLGDTVRFTANLNVRKAWSLSDTFDGKPNVLTTKPEGTTATIIEGPNYADDHTWWGVAIDGFGTGHVAENWLEKVDAPAPKPVPTGRKFTLRFETPIRTSPAFWDYDANKSNIIRTFPAGTTGRVKEGPKAAEGVNWYDVEIDGFGTGWIQDAVLSTVTIEG